MAGGKKALLDLGHLLPVFYHPRFDSVSMTDKMEVFPASSVLCCREVRGGINSQISCIFVLVGGTGCVYPKHEGSGLPELLTGVL